MRRPLKSINCLCIIRQRLVKKVLKIESKLAFRASKSNNKFVSRGEMIPYNFYSIILYRLESSLTETIQMSLFFFFLFFSYKYK